MTAAWPDPMTPPGGVTRGSRTPVRRATPPDIGSAPWWVAFVVLFLALLPHLHL